MRAVLGLLAVVLTLTVADVWAQEPRGWIGADVLDVSKAEADKHGWDGPRGAKLGLVERGSPADQAGLKAGDIVVSVDRTEVDTAAEFRAAIEGKQPGWEVRLRVRSGPQERRVAVTVAERSRTQIVDAAAVPLLMLDTGGHMATIRGVAFTPDGKQLVSAGDDKVVRVWDWQSGQTVRTIRGQVGPELGSICAMALSSDGRWLALGGQLARKIRIYDFTSGKLVALLKGHTSSVCGLAFSPDGKQLISGGFDRSAIIWDVGRRTRIRRVQVHKAEIYAVGFTPDGARAVTGSYDTTLRLWSVNDGRDIATLAGHKAQVRSLAVSPTDGTIASGGYDGEIRLWDGRTGRFLRTLATLNREVLALRFSNDGKLLLSGIGGLGTGRGLQPAWDVGTGKEVVHLVEHTVMAVAVSPDDRLAVTAGDGDNRQIQIWDIRTGESRKVLHGTGTTIRAVGFSADGKLIAWGNRNFPTLQLRLPVETQRLGEPEQIYGSILSARRAHGPHRLSHRPGGGYGLENAILDVRSDGQTLVSIERSAHDGYGHQAYSFTPDGQTIISGGGNGVLTAYGLTGTKLGEFVGHESDVSAVTPSPDGRLLVSGSADQTVRLWNLKTRELIVSLFHGRDREWVMWTPQGYYTGSPGADKIVGWQINKGLEQASDYVGAEQLRQHLNRPDIVERAIVLASAEDAVREAPGTSFKLSDLLARPVPRFRIVAPAAGAAQRGGRASVKIDIEATPDPVRLIRVHVNGRQVEEQTPDIGSGGFGAGERLVQVPLAKGRNEVRVTLTNVIGDKADTLTLTHDGDGDLDKRGTLHILAIGVTDYKALGTVCGDRSDESCDLDYAGSDAKKLADAVERRLGPGHERVEKRVLVNGGNPKDAPTANNITDAVELLRLAKETDTVVLFVAGHGKNDGPDYRFLATDASWTGTGVLRGSTAVSWQTLQAAVEAAKGRRILFIDTCHSGNAYNQRLGNAAYHANIVAYTAARFDQLAMEDASLGHGLFTYAVVEGLEGQALVPATGEISTKSLADYIVGRVGALAKALNGEQVPQYFKGRDAEDFVLARR